MSHQIQICENVNCASVVARCRCPGPHDTVRKGFCLDCKIKGMHKVAAESPKEVPIDPGPAAVELKNRPFCMAYAKICHPAGTYFAKCTDCGASGPLVATIERAAEDWNSRPEAPTVPPANPGGEALVDALQLAWANHHAGFVPYQEVRNARAALLAAIRPPPAVIPPKPTDDDAPPWPVDREDYHDALRYLIKDLAERNAAIDRIMAPAPLEGAQPTDEAGKAFRPLPGESADKVRGWREQKCANCVYTRENHLPRTGFACPQNPPAPLGGVETAQAHPAPSALEPAIICEPYGRTHLLKCHPRPFAAVMDGSKTFEWRKFDRDYQVGDMLLLSEFDPDKSEAYTGICLYRRVTYMISEGFCIPPGYCIMGIAKLEQGEAPIPTAPARPMRLRAEVVVESNSICRMRLFRGEKLAYTLLVGHEAHEIAFRINHFEGPGEGANAA